MSALLWLYIVVAISLWPLATVGLNDRLQSTRKAAAAGLLIMAMWPGLLVFAIGWGFCNLCAGFYELVRDALD